MLPTVGIPLPVSNCVRLDYLPTVQLPVATAVRDKSKPPENDHDCMRLCLTAVQVCVCIDYNILIDSLAKNISDSLLAILECHASCMGDTVSYLILSYRIVSYRIVLNCIVLYCIVSYRIVSLSTVNHLPVAVVYYWNF
jgi:hypothetical protein